MQDSKLNLPVIVAAGVCIHEGRLLASLRGEGSHLAGHWEFPGGKLEAGESPEQCVVREFREELGIEVAVARIREVVYYRYERKTVLLLFYDCSWVSGTAQALAAADARWIELGRLDELSWAPADLDFVARLQSEA